MDQKSFCSSRLRSGLVAVYCFIHLLDGFVAESKALCIVSYFFRKRLWTAFAWVVYAVVWPRVLGHSFFCWFCGRAQSALFYFVLIFRNGPNPFLFESFAQWFGLVSFFSTVIVGFEADSKGAFVFPVNFPNWTEKVFVRVVYAVAWPHVLVHMVFCWFCSRVQRALYYFVPFSKRAVERFCLSRLCSGLAACTCHNFVCWFRQKIKLAWERQFVPPLPHPVSKLSLPTELGQSWNLKKTPNGQRCALRAQSRSVIHGTRDT